MVSQSYIPSAEVWGSRLQVWTHPGLHRASKSQYWLKASENFEKKKEKK